VFYSLNSQPLLFPFPWGKKNKEKERINKRKILAKLCGGKIVATPGYPRLTYV
jgi:hypothetical protein